MIVGRGGGKALKGRPKERPRERRAAQPFPPDGGHGRQKRTVLAPSCRCDQITNKKCGRKEGIQSITVAMV